VILLTLEKHQILETAEGSKLRLANNEATQEKDVDPYSSPQTTSSPLA